MKRELNHLTREGKKTGMMINSRKVKSMRVDFGNDENFITDDLLENLDNAVEIFSCPTREGKSKKSLTI